MRVIQVIDHPKYHGISSIPETYIATILYSKISEVYYTTFKLASCIAYRLNYLHTVKQRQIMQSDQSY